MFLGGLRRLPSRADILQSRIEFRQVKGRHIGLPSMLHCRWRTSRRRTKTGSDPNPVFDKEIDYSSHRASLATTVDLTNDGNMRRSGIR
jgi:hypothetical protein